MVVRNSGSQLSEMSTISHKFTNHAMSLSCPFHGLKGQKSQGLLFEGVLYSICLSLFLVKSALWSKSPGPLSKNICLYNCLLIVFVIVFFGQAMSPHHPDQMSQRPQVSWVTLWQPMACHMYQNQKVSQLVSEWVTIPPIELSTDSICAAKNWKR